MVVRKELLELQEVKMLKPIIHDNIIEQQNLISWKMI